VTIFGVWRSIVCVASISKIFVLNPIVHAFQRRAISSPDLVLSTHQHATTKNPRWEGR
jgi:hypothetical protein